VSVRWDATLRQWFPPELAGEELLPGEGFFFYNPNASSLTLTFVGEVPQGLLTNVLPSGLSIRSSIVPQAGSLQQLGFPAEPGDAVYTFNGTTQRYTSHFFDPFELRWMPEEPRVEVGHAFFVYKEQPNEWVREFSIIGAQISAP